MTITNNSGTSYRNAELKLVAGDVKREREEERGQVRRDMMMSPKAASQQFEEEVFFEYHLYALQRRTTIKNNQTKQISLLSATGFGISKELTRLLGKESPGEDNSNCR